FVAVERDLPFFKYVGQATVSEREPRKRAEICADHGIDFEAGISQADIDLRGLDHVPPVPSAAAALRETAELETDDRAAGRNRGRIDLAGHAVHQQSGIEIVRPDTSLGPALTPNAQHLDHWSEIFTGGGQPIEIAASTCLGLDGDHLGMR